MLYFINTQCPAGSLDKHFNKEFDWYYCDNKRPLNCKEGNYIFHHKEDDIDLRKKNFFLLDLISKHFDYFSHPRQISDGYSPSTAYAAVSSATTTCCCTVSQRFIEKIHTPTYFYPNHRLLTAIINLTHPQQCVRRPLLSLPEERRSEQELRREEHGQGRVAAHRLLEWEGGVTI